ncbi:hypothetical protein EV148_103381 [Dokdonella fugitiva]|uniref:Uncharacterized protein n=1 Tax=Dokdonella fugitiva TaxID=328517 RepID=A0A4R2IAG7_9GAMM|nr:hypothetical protein EV148_103381 [Dokdonella fugitiva]
MAEALRGNGTSARPRVTVSGPRAQLQCPACGGPWLAAGPADRWESTLMFVSTSRRSPASAPSSASRPGAPGTGQQGARPAFRQESHVPLAIRKAAHEQVRTPQGRGLTHHQRQSNCHDARRKRNPSQCSSSRHRRNPTPGCHAISVQHHSLPTTWRSSPPACAMPRSWSRQQGRQPSGDGARDPALPDIRQSVLDHCPEHRTRPATGPVRASARPSGQVPPAGQRQQSRAHTSAAEPPPCADHSRRSPESPPGS